MGRFRGPIFRTLTKNRPTKKAHKAAILNSTDMALGRLGRLGRFRRHIVALPAVLGANGAAGRYQLASACAVNAPRPSPSRTNHVGFAVQRTGGSAPPGDGCAA